MRSPILLGVLSAVLIAAGIAVWWVMSRPSVEALPAPDEPAKLLPKDSGAMLVLMTRDRQVVTVPDFTYGHPSVEVEDTGVTYVYVTQDDTLTEADPSYGIIYGSDSTILLALLAKPLSEARVRGEAKLREFIPVPDAVLCALPVRVAVADTIDPAYAGRNLGLSFCPSSETL